METLNCHSIKESLIDHLREGIGVASFKNHCVILQRIIAEGSRSRLVVQDYVEEATMDRQPGFAVVIDKAKLPAGFAGSRTA